MKHTARSFKIYGVGTYTDLQVVDIIPNTEAGATFSTTSIIGDDLPSETYTQGTLTEGYFDSITVTAGVIRAYSVNEFK